MNWLGITVERLKGMITAWPDMFNMPFSWFVSVIFLACIAGFSRSRLGQTDLERCVESISNYVVFLFFFLLGVCSV